MKSPGRPRFLARRSYRRRRLTDAARLLPVVGLFLVFLPVLWQPARTPEPDTASGGIYLFAVWLVLIVVAFVLARSVAADGAAGKSDDPAEETGAEGGGGEAG